MDFKTYLTLASSSDFKATTGIVYLSTMVKISHHTHFQPSLHIPWELTRHQFSWRLPPQKLVNIHGHLVPLKKNEWMNTSMTFKNAFVQWCMVLVCTYFKWRGTNQSGRNLESSFLIILLLYKNPWKISLIFWWASVWNCFLQLTVVNLVIRANFQLPSDFCL